MKNNWRTIWWILFGVVAVCLVGINLYQWTRFNIANKDFQNAEQLLERYVSALEKHEKKKEELEKLKSTQVSLVQALNQLVFLTEKQEVPLPTAPFQGIKETLVFQNNNNDHARIRVFLPDDFRITIYARDISGLFNEVYFFDKQQRGFFFSNRSELPEGHFRPTFGGAGWHSVDRKLQGENELARVVFKVDNKVERRIKTASSAVKGSKTSGALPRIVDIEYVFDSENGGILSRIRSGWCLAFDREDEGKHCFGFVIDDFWITRD